MDSMEKLFKRLGFEGDYKPLSNDELNRFTADCYNESVGDLGKEDGINCDICKNKGYIMVVDGQYQSFTRCSCLRRRDVYKKAKRSGLGKYLNKSLDDYNTLGEDWREKCKRVVDTFIKSHAHDDAWFIACGQNGSGKTLLCSIIANTLLSDKERSVLYVVWTDFISLIKRDMMTDGKANDVSDRMLEIKNADVLFLDEVLKKHNDTDLRYLMEIINYRYTNDLKTIITSEKLLNELLDIDEATFGRAIEKCEGFMINIPRDRKKDWRLRSLKI